MVQEISPRIVKKHLKRAAKAVSIAAGISKTIRNELLKPVKKGGQNSHGGRKSDNS
ncbi:hypothetical protein SEEH2052_16435 [Salmonella enterica subsp. enterica serovar Heidelberg str. 82-2052]|nr:hypothetical protein SEEH2052_16435 [Salmonella enterica subsp. enterica serovar Heidelberg str. 82-2052]